MNNLFIAYSNTVNLIASVDESAFRTMYEFFNTYNLTDKIVLRA
jgi:hypothetical protein